MRRHGELTLAGKTVTVVLVGFAAAGALSSMSRGVVPHPSAFVLVIVGLVSFLVAKLSVVRRGYLVSFGTRRMSADAANAYRFGYWLMVVGTLLTFAP